MSEMTFTVPESLSSLPQKEQELLMGRALRSAVEGRVGQVKEEIKEGQVHLDRLKKKYELSFEEYEKKINDLEFVGVDYQEDYDEWYFWIECVKRAQDVLDSLQRFLSS